MRYIVTTTHGYDTQGRAMMVPVMNHADLEHALEDACDLLGRNLLGVIIKDGKGNSISGDDLVACCLGTAKLTPDLRTVAK